MSDAIRCAVITGASSGMGAACAREFAKAGYRVVVAGRNAARSHQVAEDLKGLVVGRVTQPDHRDELVEVVVARDELIHRDARILPGAAA